ncbi:uncharacterized protein LOC100123177 [Nasonia vitripennis]|uniref:O-acyltransferase WSD1 C-terminal domain-containing protein n=1 Tax=Nasonia vitripennis TaxID=7425 RepID=A0A7M7LML4_NASVI|nr:uncharacterized protein LOC100123177 [Nasonia vitripennis]
MAETQGCLLGLACLADPLLALLLTVVCLPTLLLSYPVCQWTRKCWARYIKWRYPNCIVVEESSTRSILDQGKNQGIYTLLVESPTIVTEHLRNHLVHLAATKPLLRMALTTKCYRYAWENLEEFSVDNHLILSPSLFKGRPITDANVQDYVSDVTSKYLAASYSPWQVHVIGQNTSSRLYFLVRVHHLLLNQEQLALGDFLPLEGTRHHDCLPVDTSPFSEPYAEPSALPRLHQKLTESFSNVWNEFLCNNDPTERPEILKKRISLWQCAKIGVIVWFATVKEISRQYQRREGLSLSEPWPIYLREAHKRNFSWSLIFQALLNLLNPAEIARTTIAWFWYIGVTLTLKSPILFWREIRAVSLLHEHHYYPDSLVSIMSFYLPLIFRASLEMFSILTILASAPFAVIEELFRRRSSAEFRPVSQTGRKVVAWSEEIDVGLLQKIAAVSGAGDAEILLAAAVDSLKEYFRCSGQVIPNEVLATAKFTSQRALYVSDCEARGLLCLALPTTTPHFEDDMVEILQVVQKNIFEARRKQRAIYAITAAETSSGIVTSCLPAIFLKIVLNHLTRRYSIQLTHVDGELPVDGLRSAVFWKPPQGNCSLSMTLHRHGRAVRLGVMGDAMIGPQHAAITRSFPASLEKLARTLGVPSDTPQQSRSPSPVVLPDGMVGNSVDTVDGMQNGF